MKYLLQNELIIQIGTRGGAFYTIVENDQGDDEVGLVLNNANSVLNDKDSVLNGGSSVPYNPINGENSVPNEQKLQEISKIARKKQRLDPEQMIELILKICVIKPMTLKELSELLNRKPDPLRKKYLSKLVAEEKLKLQYPKQINHPKQAYVTADGWDETEELVK